MAQKIKPQKVWPFFQAYHDVTYILRHDCCKEIQLHEPGKSQTYRFHNKSGKEIVVYKIDSGLINNKAVSKCDYSIYTEDNWLYLVELKGADLNHALDQINSTIEILIKEPRIKVKKLNARIVLSRVSIPRITASKENKLKKLLHKSYGGGDYKKQSRTIEETI